MALDYSTTNSGLFYRFGRMAGLVADIVALKGGTATARVLSGASMQTRATTFETMAAASPAVSPYIDGHWTALAGWQSAQGGYEQSTRALAEKILIEQVHADASLPSKDIISALREVERQMRATADSVNASAVALGAQTAVGTPTGNPIFVGTLKSVKGRTWEAMLAETIRFTATNDSNLGATARQEPFSIRGSTAAPSVFSHLWPAGSGAAASITLVDAQRDNSGGNKLTNSDFETFTTANYPDNWVIAVGAAGTDVNAAGAGYTQSNALKITGDGSTLTCLRQTFDTAASTTAGLGGTPGTLAASTRYAVNLFMKRDNAIAAGVLRVRLVDGSNAVVSDDSGTECSFTCDLTTLTASYASFTGTFVTPTVMPASIKLELALTTAVDNADSIFIDDLALAPMTQLYVGGPSFAGFAGSTAVAINDQWTRAVTNTMGTLQMWMERFFQLAAKGVQLPSDSGGTETVADSLVA
jgi:hypothetical protein